MMRMFVCMYVCIPVWFYSSLRLKLACTLFTYFVLRLNLEKCAINSFSLPLSHNSLFGA